MYNYNIKAKHMDTMTSFFTSKNFELKTRFPSPPPQEKSKKAAAVEDDKAKKMNKKTSGAMGAHASSNSVTSEKN